MAKSRVSAQVTLTSAGTVYNLYTLVNAVLVAAGEAVLWPKCRELVIQSVAANVDPLLVGDAALSSTRIGLSILPGDSYTYRSDRNSIPLKDYRLLCTVTASQKVNIDINVS